MVENAMNAVTYVKTNPIVFDKTTARKLTPLASSSFSFPIGYHELHPGVSINFRRRRQ
jgi:hypothetical protein